VQRKIERIDAAPRARVLGPARRRHLLLPADRIEIPAVGRESTYIGVNVLGAVEAGRSFKPRRLLRRYEEVATMRKCEVM
jgi:hypothetical protein